MDVNTTIWTFIPSIKATGDQLPPVTVESTGNVIQAWADADMVLIGHVRLTNDDGSRRIGYITKDRKDK